MCIEWPVRPRVHHLAIPHPVIIITILSLSLTSCASKGAAINTSPREKITQTSQTSQSSQTSQTNLAATSNRAHTLNCSASSSQFQTIFIASINQIRAQPRTCGNTSHKAAGPLRWNEKLSMTARRHSLDMAGKDFFSHTGSDKTDAGDRVDAVNYEWEYVGENLAAGQTNLQEAIDGWLDSPGHCRNVMNTHFKEAGLACVENQSTEFGIYWTNVFGAQFD